jgi:hypothetical protein
LDAKENEEDNKNQEDASASAAATIQTLQIAEAVKRIPGRENWQHIDHEIVFETGDVAPLSQKRFSFRRKKIQAQTAAAAEKNCKQSSKYEICPFFFFTTALKVPLCR